MQYTPTESNNMQKYGLVYGQGFTNYDETYFRLSLRAFALATLRINAKLQAIMVHRFDKTGLSMNKSIHAMLYTALIALTCYCCDKHMLLTRVSKHIPSTFSF